MSRKHRPRVEFHFNVVQTPRDRDYVPPRARDEDRVALFEGGPPGIVIAKDQKIGSKAVERAFDWATAEGSEEDLLSAANLFAYTSLGTAYHLYAQHDVQDVMYRKPQLPRAIDLETGEYVEFDDMVADASLYLSDAAMVAEQIEQTTVEQREPRKLNKRLGRELANAGLLLAAIADKTTSVRGDSVEVQDQVYLSAQRAYVEMLELSGKIGVRPTVAQIPNRHSPLMVHLHNDRFSVTQPVLTKINNEIEELTANESRPQV